MTISQIVMGVSASSGPSYTDTGEYIWDGSSYTNSTFISTSSTGYPMISNGGAASNISWGGTKSGYVMRFDGAGGYYYTPDLNSRGQWKINHTGDPSFTLQFWFYPTALGSALSFMTDGNGVYKNNLLEIGANGRVYAQLWENNQVGSPAMSNTEVILNAWNHVYLQFNYNSQLLTLSLNNDTPIVLTSYVATLPLNDSMVFGFGATLANPMTVTPPTPLPSFTGDIAYIQVDNTTVNSTFVTQRSWFYNSYTPPVFNSGPLGGSMYFDGTNSFASIPITTTGLRFAPGTADFTIEWWQHQDSNGANTDVFPFCIYDPSLGNVQIMLRLSSSGNGFYYSDAGINNVYFGSVANLRDRWAHIALVRKNGYMTIYVDGKAINNTIDYHIPSNITNLGPTGAKFTIGGQADQSGGVWAGTLFTGNLTNFNFINGTAKYTGDFVPSSLPFTVEAGVVTKMLLLTSSQANMMYDTAASHNTVTNHSISWAEKSPFLIPYFWVDAGNINSWAGDGTWYDLGTGGHNVTFPNSISYSASNGGVLQFTASSNQYGELADLGAMASFTINAWFNLDTITGFLPCIFTQQYQGGPTDINYALGFINTNSEIGGGFFKSSNWQTAGATPPTTATWYNMTVTYDGATIRFYVNGTLNSYTNYGASFVHQPLGSYIGRRWDNLETIDGKIPVVHIYNRKLSDSEIAALYNALSSRY